MMSEEGSDCMKVNERMTYDDIVRQYPSKWVILSDVERKSNENPTIISALLLEVVDDNDINSMRLKYLKEGKKYVYCRTTEGMSAGVIHCENYTMVVK